MSVPKLIVGLNNIHVNNMHNLDLAMKTTVMESVLLSLSYIRAEKLWAGAIAYSICHIFHMLLNVNHTPFTGNSKYKVTTV